MSAPTLHRPEMLLDKGAKIQKAPTEVSPSTYSRAVVNHRNHFGHDGTHNSECPWRQLFFNCGEEYWYYAQGDCQFALPAIERQISFVYLQRFAISHFRRYNITNREDTVKICILKYGRSFRQEGIFGTNIIRLHLGFVNKDALVNEVVVDPNTFGNELVIDAQYPDGDTRFPGWIKLTDTQWWTRLLDYTRGVITRTEALYSGQSFQVRC
ncbi:uncharacterized protein A4U43_C04F27190 [Asparagus officinalis]|uniref:Uncharacterized protein n=1 Tax=Asparagus officinalis TaxID=4686 RepID=A0A5P1F9A5_ASPOF|nr:uncharacterized protein A4U43_C04F27190 [Asparagus officinalis]